MASQMDSPTPPAVEHPQQGGQNPASPDRPPSSPPTQTSEVTIGFINCVGQSKFPLSKQLEIENHVRSHKIDILHLQEIMIDEASPRA